MTSCHLRRHKCCRHAVPEQFLDHKRPPNTRRRVKRFGTESEINAELRRLTADVRDLRKELSEMTARGKRRGSLDPDQQLRLGVIGKHRK